MLNNILYRSRFKNLFRFIFYLVALVLLVSIISNIKKINSLNERVWAEKLALTKIEKENSDLKKKIEEVNSQAFIEQQARDKLGLAKEGETVVVLPDTEELKKSLNLGSSDPQITPEPNWKKWLHIFGF